MVPRARGSQLGAPSPVSAGTKYTPPVESIDDDSGRQRQEEQRNPAGKAGQADEERRVGLLQREPADGDLVHPEGRVGRQRPHEEQPERPEGLQRVEHPTLFGRQRDDRLDSRRTNTRLTTRRPPQIHHRYASPVQLPETG